SDTETVTFAEAANATTLTSTAGTYGTPLTLSSSTTTASTGAISYQVISAGSAECTIVAGQLVAGHAGTCSVEVTQADDGNFVAASDTETVTFAEAANAITLTSIAGTYGTPLTLSSSTTTASTGAISYQVISAGSAECTIVAGQLVAGHAGTCSVEVTQADDGNFVAASDTETVTFAEAANAITLTSIAGTYGTPLTLSSSTTTASTGAISYQVISAGSAECTIVAGQLVAGHAGTCSVEVTQADDGNFVAASDTETVTFAEAANAITLTSIAGTYGTPLTLSSSTTTASTGAISYQVISAGSAECTIVAGQLVAGHAGTCSVEVTQADDGNFVAASDTETVTFAEAANAITLTSTAGTYGTPLTLSSSTTTASTGAISYQVISAGSAECTIVARQLVAGHASNCSV